MYYLSTYTNVCVTRKDRSGQRNLYATRNSKVQDMSLNKEVRSMVSCEENQAWLKSKQDMLTSISYLDAVVWARTSRMTTEL